MGNYYFLNIKEYDLWSVLLIDFKTDDSVVVSMITLEDESLLSSLEIITNIGEEVYENSDEVRYVIDPTHEELVQIINNKLFNPISTFRKINRR